MGFWKSLFSTSDTAAKIEPDGSSAQGVMVGSSRIFFSTDREIDLYELEELCDAVGWSRRPLRKVKKAIQHSFLVVSMWEQRGVSKRLVGFSRATSDQCLQRHDLGCSSSPGFSEQRAGQGADAADDQEAPQPKTLATSRYFADPQVIDFYRGLGFMPDPEGIKGMFWYPD